VAIKIGLKGRARAGLWLAVASVALAAPSGVAYSQTAEADAEADEIIVTARKREERIQDAPLAITAFSAQMLEDRNISSVADLGRYVPNVSISASANGGGGSSNPQIFIRGVGQNDFIITTDPGVGIYIDGVYYARSTGGVLDLLDVERVEVLRGPQGTLFGRNTIGGALSLISRRPTDEFSGRAEVAYGSFDRTEIEGSLNIPISPNLASSVSAAYRRADGFQENVVTGEDLGDVDAFSGRANFLFEPTPELSLFFSADVTSERENSAAAVMLEFDPGAPLAALWQGLVGTPAGVISPVYLEPLDDDDLQDRSTGPNRSDLDLWGVSLTADWQPGEVALKSITAYRELTANFANDQDNSEVDYNATNNVVDQSQFSQELQVLGSSFDDRMDWIVGLYYFREQATDRNSVRIAQGLYNALEGLPGAFIPLAPGAVCPGDPFCAGGAGNPLNAQLDIEFNALNEIETRSYAAFTNASFQLTEEWSISGGLRYTSEEKDYFTDQVRINAGVPLIPPTAAAAEFDALTYRFGLEYQPSADLLVYASVSTGFKSGGFNGRPTTVAEIDSFDPEEATSYELGVKSDWFGRRLRLNLAAFLNQYSDIQLSSISADSGGNLITVTENAGEAELKGLELEMTALLTDSLTFSAAIGYIDAEFTRLNPGATISLDTRFVRTPEWTGSAGLSYERNLASGAEVMARVDWSYRSEVANDVPNTASLIDGDLNLVTARASYQFANSPYEIAIFGSNLLDERYIESGFSAIGSVGVVEGVVGRPREIGVSVSMRF